jgi:hypothetical protein
MSEMKTIIAIRIPFSLKEKPEDEKAELDFIRSILKREPDEFYGEEDWYYETNKGQWVINKPNGQWYFDYPLEIENDSHEINTKISLSHIKGIVIKGVGMLKNSPLVLEVEPDIIQALYFYNGAASGLSDIS